MKAREQPPCDYRNMFSSADFNSTHDLSCECFAVNSEQERPAKTDHREQIGLEVKA